MAGESNIRRGQTKVGVVASKPGDKTVKVLVERLIPHAVYKRVIRRSKYFLAHDERNLCNVGDKVEIAETRPLSARKRWRVTEIILRAEGAAPSVDQVVEDEAGK